MSGFPSPLLFLLLPVCQNIPFSFLIMEDEPVRERVTVSEWQESMWERKDHGIFLRAGRQWVTEEAGKIPSSQALFLPLGKSAEGPAMESAAATGSSAPASISAFCRNLSFQLKVNTGLLCKSSMTSHKRTSRRKRRMENWTILHCKHYSRSVLKHAVRERHVPQ